MKSINKLLIILFALSLFACGGGGGGSSNPPAPDPTPTNTAPVANAGADLTVDTNTLVQLNGSSSSDANGDNLTFRWSLTVPAGSSASLSATNVATPSFTPDIDGQYVAQLIVNDGTVDSSADTVNIVASTPNTAPVANAGSSQTVITGMAATLDGSASADADGDAITFQWTLASVPGGSSAALTNDTSPTPTLTTDLEGVYTIELVVNDGQTNSNTASVTVTAETPNVVPVANAGIDRTVDTASTVTLDGSLSSDGNNDSLTYAWTILTKPDDSSASLNDASAEMPEFVADKEGDYTIQLVVNDGQVDSAAVTITITAVTPNVVPTANAGIDQNINTGETVTLDGTASFDGNGDSITYLWTITSSPNGSLASLNDNTLSMPEFVADLDGAYQIELVVNDGMVDSAVDSVTVTATTLNSAPVANAGADQNVSTGTLVTLDGTASSDADGDMLTYLWTLSSVPAGSSASFNDNTLASPSFTADVDGSYVAELVVNDGTDSSAVDSVTVSASTANSMPTANAGTDQNVNVDSLVTLDGSASSDPDGDSLTFSWSFTSIPMGSSSTLTDPSTVSPSFTPDVEGIYTAQLIVNDGAVDSSADTVNITASVVNSAPVANAGEDQRTNTATLVSLDGSASTDADGDSLTYLWTFVSRPAGSTASLSDPQAVNPSFTTDEEGSYVLSLVVSDGMESSAADTVQVVVSDTTVELLRNVGTREIDFNPVPFPFTRTGALNVSIVTNPLPDTFTLNTFKITAQGGDLTVTNLVATNQTNALVPSITGLSEGQVLADGTQVTFRLLSPLTGGETIDLLFSFEIAETGDTFVAEYRFTSN